MFDDLKPQKKSASDFPRNLDGLSIDELNDYVAALHDEIRRVEMDRDKKKASQDAAASVFKS